MFDICARSALARELALRLAVCCTLFVMLACPQRAVAQSTNKASDPVAIRQTLDEAALHQCYARGANEEQRLLKTKYGGRAVYELSDSELATLKSANVNVQTECYLHTNVILDVLFGQLRDGRAAWETFYDCKRKIELNRNVADSFGTPNMAERVAVCALGSPWYRDR